MKSYFEIRQLGDKALQSAIDWALYVSDPDDEITEEQYRSKVAKLHQKLTDDFNRFTYAKYDFEPERDQYMDMDFQALRLEEAMKLVTEANHVLLVDDVRNLCIEMLKITKYDYAFNIPEWQAADDEEDLDNL